MEPEETMTKKCTHHWLCEPPKDGQVHAKCRDCLETRVFPANGQPFGKVKRGNSSKLADVK